MGRLMELESYLAGELEDVFQRAVRLGGAHPEELVAALHVALLRETTRHDEAVVSACLRAGAGYFQSIYEDAEVV